MALSEIRLTIEHERVASWRGEAADFAAIVSDTSKEPYSRVMNQRASVIGSRPLRWASVGRLGPRVPEEIGTGPGLPLPGRRSR
jgi:hypothetical protein